MKTLFIAGMHGLGDNIYQRPFVRAQLRHYDAVYLQTPWPHLYHDMPGLRFVRPTMEFPTYAKAANSVNDATWSDPPADAETVRLFYDARDFEHGSLVAALERKLPLHGEPFDFGLPDFGPPPIDVPKGERLAVIRPTVLRADWENRARNCLPKYITQAADVLQNRGFFVVSVADVDGVRERFDGTPPFADLQLLRGELDSFEVLALLQHAYVVVSPVGFMVPACTATLTRLVVIAGGNGAHNSPEAITDPRMDVSRTRWIFPHPYCRCTFRLHECFKKIRDFPAQFMRTLDDVMAT